MIKLGRGLSHLLDRETARPWSEIEQQYFKLAETHEVFRPLAELVHYLARSGFAKAGLCAATSMHDLVLGRSTRVFQEPHLRVEYNELGTFTLIYVNGAKKPWERAAAPEHLTELVTRFLTKRVRWYHVGEDGA